jgi:hypothetical protein
VARISQVTAEPAQTDIPQIAAHQTIILSAYLHKIDCAENLGGHKNQILHAPCNELPAGISNKGNPNGDSHLPVYLE